MANEDKPKSNMEIAVEALKAEIAEEAVKPTPSWVKISKLTKFLQAQRVMPSLAEAVREEIAAAGMPPGVGAYVTEDDSDPNNFMPYMRRVRTPSMATMPVIPADVQAFIDKFLAISPFQADKAKKMLECASLLDQSASNIEDQEKRKSIYEYCDKLRERAMDILRPEFGDLPEEIKPAIRHLDLEDGIDAEFEAK